MFAKNTMDAFQWDNPTKVHIGKGAVSQLSADAKAAGVRRALVLSGSSAAERCGALPDTRRALEEAGVDVLELPGVMPNPDFEQASQAIIRLLRAAIFEKQPVDTVVAVGGGSTYDTAKAVASGYVIALEHLAAERCMASPTARQSLSGIVTTVVALKLSEEEASALFPALTEHLWDVYTGKHPIPTRALPIYGVLTISATGSEANCNSVLSRRSRGLKLNFNAHCNYPAHSYVDPSYQFHLSHYQLVNGLVDALMHVMEFLVFPTDPEEHEVQFSVDCALARSILKVGREIEREDPSCAASADADSQRIRRRNNFIWAATNALNGFAKTTFQNGSFVTHKLSYAVSGYVPTASHGAAVGVIFPAFVRTLKAYGKNADGTFPYAHTFARIARDVFGEVFADDSEGPERLVAAWYAMLDDYGHPKDLEALYGRKVTDQDISELVRTFETTNCPFGFARECFQLMRDASAVARGL